MIKTRSFIAFLLLSIITCGIYGIIYWYQFNEDVNTLCEGDGRTTSNFIVVILLSIITCGIYMWVWYYKEADRLYCVAPKYGTTVSEDGTKVILFMLLGLIIAIGPFIGMYILTNNINKLAVEYNAGKRPVNG